MLFHTWWPWTFRHSVLSKISPFGFSLMLPNHDTIYLAGQPLPRASYLTCMRIDLRNNIIGKIQSDIAEGNWLLLHLFRSITYCWKCEAKISNSIFFKIKLQATGTHFFYSTHLTREIVFRVTTDAWTSRVVASYLSLTVHYINKNFETHPYMLSLIYLIESYRGEFIQGALIASLAKWSLNNLTIPAFLSPTMAAIL